MNTIIFAFKWIINTIVSIFTGGSIFKETTQPITPKTRAMAATFFVLFIALLAVVVLIWKN